jgi:hypothetical protein
MLRPTAASLPDDITPGRFRENVMRRAMVDVAAQIDGNAAPCLRGSDDPARTPCVGVCKSSHDQITSCDAEPDGGREKGVPEHLIGVEASLPGAGPEALTYASLRPQELLALQWNDIHERAILVRRKNVDGELYPYTKTARTAASSSSHHSQATWPNGSSPAGAAVTDVVVVNGRGKPWTKHQYQHWRRHVYKPHAFAIGLTSGVPYDLRGSFVSLLAWEGQTMLEVARQAGHSVAICERHYAGIFEDYDPAARTSAEAAIRAAREPDVREVCALVDEAAEG